MTILDECARLLDAVRARRPLVHHLTNYVTVNDCANVTLAIGGSPVMATAPEEAGDIAAISSAVVLNIGTLSRESVASMIIAGKSANARGVPVVFDPVGAGASPMRNEAAAEILATVDVAVIRGNISEICAVSGLASHTKGVDADQDDRTVDPAGVAASFAKKRGCVVAVTGPRDSVGDGAGTVWVDNGNAMLSQVSGTGCMCTSMVGAFVGASPDRPLLGAAAAILCMGIAGDIAFEKAGGLGYGSYRVAVMDAISRMDGTALRERGKIGEAAC